MPVWFYFLLILGFCNADRSDYHDGRRIIGLAGARSVVDDAEVNSANVCWSRPQHLCHRGLELLLTNTCQPSLLISSPVGF